MATAKRDDWGTPKKLFEQLNNEFRFTLDAASNDTNYKCEKHYTIKEDGLKQDWSNESVYLNPPYGRCLKDWCRKCYEERKKAKVIVALLPSRTDTSYFHDYIYNKAEVRFLRGRLKFDDSKYAAPFPSMIVIWK